MITSLLIIGLFALSIVFGWIAYKNIRSASQPSKVISIKQPPPDPQGGARSISLRKRRAPYGLLLAGFDTEARKIRIKIAKKEFDEAFVGVSIGRDSDIVDKVIDSHHVSKRHARIAWVEGEFQIEDLRSTNTTVIEKKTLEPYRPHPLHLQDEIELGGIKLVVFRG